MNPLNTYISPLAPGHYAPHLYGFRQLHGYENPLKAGRPRNQGGAYVVYDFSTGPSGRARDDGPQTVEQMIEQGYLAVSRSEPEFAVIHDKKRTAWLGLDDVIALVRQRYEVFEQNIYEIEQAKCDAVNALFAWEARYGWPASSKQEYVLGKRLQELYADQRAERVAAWRDISRLRQSLPEAAQNYLSAYRKLAVLEDPSGDDR